MTDGMCACALGAHSSARARMRLENGWLARSDVSFDNEVLILDHKRGWQPIAIQIHADPVVDFHRIGLRASCSHKRQGSRSARPPPPNLPHCTHLVDEYRHWILHHAARADGPSRGSAAEPGQAVDLSLSVKRSAQRLVQHCSCGTAPSRPTFEVVRQAPRGAPPHATACEGAGRPQACIERAKASSLELLVRSYKSQRGEDLSQSHRWLSVYTVTSLTRCHSRICYLAPGAARSTPLSPYKPLSTVLEAALATLGYSGARCVVGEEPSELELLARHRAC